MSTLGALAQELCAVGSVSRHEAALCALLEERLGRSPHLELTRVGDNLVARTPGPDDERVVLAGHLDTVPANGNAVPRLADGVLWGLGSSDMLGGVAVMVALVEHLVEPRRPLTYVFYAREEIARDESGLHELFATQGLVAGSVAVVLEPTNNRIEAGCQGTLRMRLELGGVRAHTSRPFAGRNAIHRLAPVLELLANYRPREVVLDGCTYAEQLQAVAVDGGVSGNVVPDHTSIEVNLRFAPDRTLAQAEDHLRGMLAGVLELEAHDQLVVIDGAPGALPNLGHPVLEALGTELGTEPLAKVAWTDVASFAARGIPATNFGPGDPFLAHHPDERVSVAALQRCYEVLLGVLG